MRLGHVWILDLASLALFLFKFSSHEEAYLFISKMGNLKVFSPLLYL